MVRRTGRIRLTATLKDDDICRPDFACEFIQETAFPDARLPDDHDKLVGTPFVFSQRHVSVDLIQAPVPYIASALFFVRLQNGNGSRFGGDRIAFYRRGSAFYIDLAPEIGMKIRCNQFVRDLA